MEDKPETGKVYYFFFQNMQNFSAKNLGKSVHMKAALGEIQALLPDNGKIVVAGFAELTTNLDKENMGCVCQHLNATFGKHNQCFEVEQGNRKEKLYIGYDPCVEEPKWGLVYRTNKGEWLIKPGETNLPNDRDKAYRAMAYIAGKICGQRVVVGFLHNVYGNGEITDLPKNLSAIFKQLQEKYKAPAIYLGADFNLDYKAFEDLKAKDVCVYAPEELVGDSASDHQLKEGQTYGTSKANRAYDYFVTNFREKDLKTIVCPQTQKDIADPPADQTEMVRKEAGQSTYQNQLSDHCGVAIRFVGRTK